MKKNQNPIIIIRSLLIASASLMLLGITLGGLSQHLIQNHINLIHQLSVGISGILLLGSYFYVLKTLKDHNFLKTILSIAIFCLGIEFLLGQILFRSVLQNWLVGLHYAVSVIILGLVLSAIIYLIELKSKEALRLSILSSYSKFTLVGVSLGFLAFFSGVYISLTGLAGACSGWPLCETGEFPRELSGWIVYIHRIVVALVGAYLLWFSQQSWRKQRSQPTILTVSNLFVVLFVAQGFIGALKTIQDFPIALVVLHETSAVVFVGIGFILVTAVGLKARTEQEEIQEANVQFNHRQRFMDILALNKPVVVLLLLSTTIAGMIIGAGKLPSMDILMVTIIGGFLAAGGSSAINQYIDRDLDKLMVRTAKRPIPSGRLMPAEGLAFGVTALVISFYLLAGFVNILAALLALTGMLYYVVFYSVILKNKTVQNIVIGGGAGAIPPLVGWAAATGSLNLASLFLFLIIFLWTPPHFWALALLRMNEYAAAKVPMMPVKRGEEATKILIFQYSIVLVLTSLLIWVLGFAGWVYFGGAVLLGIYMLYLAQQVLKNGRNRVYYKMYRHSNYYLLFLFVFMAIDSVIRAA